jgi:hypothetical protein
MSSIRVPWPDSSASRVTFRAISSPAAAVGAGASRIVRDAEQTAAWLERAYQERSVALPFLGVLPTYERVRSHPKVVAILEQMKLKNVGERD